VENANKLFLGHLKRLCAPKLGKDNTDNISPDNILCKWPNHFNTAIAQLNNRILPAFKHSPRKLLLGLVINTPKTPTDLSTTVLITSADVSSQMAYVKQQHLDGFAHALEHVVRRKAAFDKRVHRSGPGEAVFKPGNYVQVYNSALDYTFKTKHKLLPQWSPPHQVVKHLTNSY
jgi:hypothetical protein